KALARLESIKARVVKREVDGKSLDAAIAEAKRRVADAKNAEAMAEAARVADELLELATMFREAGGKCDRALKLLAQGRSELRKSVQGENQRVWGNPSPAKLQALGSRAILEMINNSPYAKFFPHIAPAERKSFATFTEAWAAMIERHVNTKLGG